MGEAAQENKNIKKLLDVLAELNHQSQGCWSPWRACSPKYCFSIIPQGL